MTDYRTFSDMMAANPTESVRALVLDSAREAVTKDRAATHGDAEDSFAKIAGIWSVLLGVTVTPAQVCVLMGVVKDVRAWGNPDHPDNWVDKAGYAACGGEVAAVAAARRAAHLVSDDVPAFLRRAPQTGAVT